jgi:hypothetical protein
MFSSLNSFVLAEPFFDRFAADVLVAQFLNRIKRFGDTGEVKSGQLAL